MGVQSTHLEVGIDRLATDAVEELCQQGLAKENEGRLETTVFGTAAYKGPIDAEIVGKLFDDLRTPLCQGLVLATHLHLLLCVVPYDLLADLQPNWNIFYKEVSGKKQTCSLKVTEELSVLFQFCSLSSQEKRVLELQGIDEAYLVKKMTRFGSLKVKDVCVLTCDACNAWFVIA